MNQSCQLEYSRLPSALKYMSLAALPKEGFKKTQHFPKIAATWKNYRSSVASLEIFSKLTGLPIDKTYHPLFLHTVAFRLAMAVLTHPAFPEAIWRILQVRSVVVQRQSLALEDPFSLTVGIKGHRVVKKGVEVDLCASVCAPHSHAPWESTSTFYIRGDFCPDGEYPAEKRPEVPVSIHSGWHFPRRGRRAFGSLTGDYNGIHMWDWYARMFGFNSAFAHPQRVMGQILNRLFVEESIGASARIETWFKGPVYYGSSVELRASEKGRERIFSLHVSGDQRPAILGRVSER